MTDRADKWASIQAIANEILDERITNTLAVHVSSVNRGDFMVYLLANVTLGQDAYDKIRKIAEDHGGSVIVLESRDQAPYNIRIWGG